MSTPKPLNLETRLFVFNSNLFIFNSNIEVATISNIEVATIKSINSNHLRKLRFTYESFAWMLAFKAKLN